MSDIVLASASRRRAELLSAAGVAFRVVPSQAREEAAAGGPPAELVRGNARRKAADVAARVEAAFVIGADTVVVLDDAVLGKPADRAVAEGMLRRLQGRDHVVLTGVAVAARDAGVTIDAVARTRVRFAPLSEAALAAYLGAFEPLDKAGAYAIQGPGALVIEAVEGCYYNVVGLPLNALEGLFQRLGRSLLCDPALRGRAE